LIAHGSRREASNQEVRELATGLGRICGDQFQIVLPAFLELAEPDISAGVDRCVEAGASRVTAVPYFLSAGRHVAHDIPAELEKAAQRHPAVTIHQTGYLGTHESVAELLLSLALQRADTATPNQAVRATG
jgi:sirohydrochlorin ferrochelatase